MMRGGVIGNPGLGPSRLGHYRIHNIMGIQNHKGDMVWETNSVSNTLPAFTFLDIVFKSPWLEVSQQGEVYG